MHTKTELAPAVVCCLATVHLALLLAEHDFEAFRTLVTATLALTLFRFLTFGYLFAPLWYKLVGRERGGLSVNQIQKSLSSRLVTCFLTELAGNIGIGAFLGSTFSLSSYQQAIRTSGLLYLGSVLPNVHHYFWEERSLGLIYVVEIYQLLRRIVAASAIVVSADVIWQETLPGNNNAYPTNTLTIPIVPCVIMSVIRFALGFLWYGPLMGYRVWLPAIREFKNDNKFPTEAAKKDIPYLLVGGFLCGQVQNALLLPLQAQLNATSTVADALKLGYTLFFFFVLPTVSTDVWEGKAYRLSFVNYSLYLVEVCLLFAVNALYQSM